MTDTTALTHRARKHRRKLNLRLRGLGRVVVAYSGGVDSTLVAALAYEALGKDAIAVTAVSPAVPEADIQAATDLARERGWPHRLLDTAELARPDYVRNGPDRCYSCKTELFSVLAPIAKEREAVIVTGTNADDLSDHRPGRQAAREYSVREPLAEAGLTKADVRALSALMELPTADKPAAPCLASRLAYGVRVSADALTRIDRAESYLRDLGFDIVRVRDHGNMARIEVPEKEIPRLVEMGAGISEFLGGLGFVFVTVDLVGFRSGSLNAVL